MGVKRSCGGGARLAVREAGWMRGRAGPLREGLGARGRVCGCVGWRLSGCGRGSAYLPATPCAHDGDDVRGDGALGGWRGERGGAAHHSKHLPRRTEPRALPPAAQACLEQLGRQGRALLRVLLTRPELLCEEPSEDSTGALWGSVDQHARRRRQLGGAAGGI
eukprot:scaffold3329_cov120-Isochrysis_galbana.AAC.11